MAALMGLGVNLRPWKQGLRNADALVKKGLGPASLGPFNKAVYKTFKNLQYRMRGIARWMTSLQGVIVGIAGAAVMGKVVGWMKEAVDLSRQVADSWSRVELSARTGFPELDTEELREYGEQFSRAFGLGLSETFDSISKFMTGGATGEQLKGLMQLAADMSAKTGKSLEQSVKMVQDASQGKLDSLAEAGFIIRGTGDAAIDAATALQAMQDHAAGAAATITNPSQRLERSLENIKATVGDRLLPLLDPLITKVDNILLGWENSSIDQDLKTVVDSVMKVGKGVVWVAAKAVDLGRWLQESTAMLYTGSVGVVRMLRLVAVDGTKWILAMIKEQILGFIADLPGLLPFGLGEKLAEAMGGQAALDKMASEAALAADLAGRNTLGAMEREAKGMSEQWEALKASRDAVFGAGPSTGSRLNDRLQELEAQGAGIRAASMESITAQAAASAGGAGGLVNPGVYEEKQRQEEERRAQQREEWVRRREEQMEAAAAARDSGGASPRVRGVGNVGDGSQVRVTIVSARGDKFRKQGRRR